MLQNLQNDAKFQTFQLDNLVDFEKCCKARIFLQRSAPIQPKTSEILPKFCRNVVEGLRLRVLRHVRRRHAGVLDGGPLDAVGLGGKILSCSVRQITTRCERGALFDLPTCLLKYAFLCRKMVFQKRENARYVSEI